MTSYVKRRDCRGWWRWRSLLSVSVISMIEKCDSLKSGQWWEQDVQRPFPITQLIIKKTRRWNFHESGYLSMILKSGERGIYNGLSQTDCRKNK